MSLDRNQALTKLGKRGACVAIIIPKKVLEQLPWRLGETILVTVRGSHIIAQRVELPRVPVVASPALEGRT